MPLDPVAYVPPSEFYSPRPSSQLPDTFLHRPLYPPHPFGPYVDPTAYMRPPTLPKHTSSIMSYGEPSTQRFRTADMAPHGYTHAFEAIAGLDMQAEMRSRYSLQALDYYHRQAALGANGLFQSMDGRAHLPEEDSTGQNM